MNREILLQHMSDGVLALDGDFRVTAVNGRAETMLQRQARRLLGAPVWDCIPDLAGSRAEEDIREVCASNFARRVEHFSPSRYVWYELHAVPAEGECLIFMRDVTDRARQMQSDAVKAQMRRLLMDAPIAVSILKAPELRYEMVNTRARQLIGNRDIEGWTMRNAFPELEGSGLFEIVEQVVVTGKAASNRNVMVKFDRNGDGVLHEGVFDVTYQPLLDSDGTVSGVMSVGVEVTDYYRARELLEATQQQGGAGEAEETQT